ncbi:MAG: ECF transporter S component [Ruminococcaceae bacterium]|nr:ECF transporter S component [Oscillospiraceae bacterium]
MQKINIRTICKIAILTAIASIIMLLEFPLPFAPVFYKLDLSETVILMGGFAMGPMAAAIIELLKNLMNLLLNGTTTAYIGEMANFITGCAFVVPASLIYKYRKTFKGALLAMAVGTVSLAIVGGLLNYFVLIPAFSEFYHLEIDKIIAMGSAVNPLVADLKTLVVFAVAPFNLVKGIICSGLTLLLYKRLSKILHI